MASPYPTSSLLYQTFAPPSRSNTFIAMSRSSSFTPTPTPYPAAALPSYNSVGQSTDPWGVVWKYLTSEGYWTPVIPHTSTASSSLDTGAPSSFSTGAPSSSMNSAAVDSLSGSNPPPSNPNGLGLPALVGISVSSVLVLVAIVTGCCWVRHRRKRAERRDARQMREIGVERVGAWTFENPPPEQRDFARIPSPTNSQLTLPRYPDQLISNLHVPHRQSTTTSVGTSAWEDDSELDMLATDGSTLARTLSTRSTSSLSTIRTLQSSGDRDRLDHPGYTYRSNTVTSASRSRSTPGSTFVSTRNGGGLSPFADPTGSSVSPTTSYVPSSTGISPITPLPRAAARLSTTSSNNPFADALPVYSIEETSQAPVNPFADRLGDDMGRERARASDPPAYGDLYRR